ncbi:MAG: cysteine desulfurase-like protein [Chitinophagaceae bacterium]|nr:cysteine desulfurase-like protein [Chitinophagaceae bacterium]
MFQPGEIRKQFPSLQRHHNGQPLIFLDGPGGTQVPQATIDSISDYYKKSNSNTHGEFITTKETDELIHTTRQTVATFLNAENEKTISFGQNMTTLNFSLARAIGRTLKPGDEILITQLDHEGNRGPWLMLRELGIKVREVLLEQDGTLNYDDLAEKLNENTRLVAIGMASNALGTVNDVPLVRKLTYKYNCLLMVDAVAYAPHFTIDVQQLGCDFLICSAYKFYGPHVGILYSRPGLLDRMQPDRLRTTDQFAPYCIETGTLNHAALAGVLAAIKFIATLGGGNNLRETIVDAYKKLGAHEYKLAVQLYEGIKNISGLKVIGQDFSSVHRAPTVSFTLEGKTPAQVCSILGSRNICAWDGHFYAARAIEVLGLMEKGGVTRLGLSLYNSAEEVNTVISEIKALSN